MATRIRIGKNTELSLLPGSLVVTDATNEQFYLPPALVNGQVLTTVAGVPTWATPVAANGVDDEFVAIAAQTAFTLTAVPNSLVVAYRNGLKLPKLAVTYVGTAATYVPAANGGLILAAADRINFVY